MRLLYLARRCFGHPSSSLGAGNNFVPCPIPPSARLTSPMNFSPAPFLASVIPMQLGRKLIMPLGLTATFGLTFSPTVTVVAQTPSTDPDFASLKQQLEAKQFKVLLSPPPQRGDYGLLNAESRTIWIHPLTFELGIAVPVIVHEAVHAAQVCKGQGQLAPLGVTVEPLVYARPFWLRYNEIHRQDLEREAFTIQTQPNRIALVSDYLKQFCRS
ncbi:hypothetical protein IQ225_12660 [Synechocystis salina LEGE 06155]|nr:hypothetical protein [Synechocystis salina LEGE 06155]